MRALTIVLVLTAATTPAIAERVSAGPLALRGPDRIVLGSDTAVTVRLRASARPIRLVTNAGAISTPVRDGTELRATFTPPLDRFPQLALIAAVGEDGAIADWIAIPMAGRAVVRVDTAPGAMVVVRVDGAEFGPVEATARGVAEVPIIVPPAITQVTTIATARSGAIREKLAPLGAAPFGTTLAVCSPGGDRIRVLATTLRGTAAELPPQVTASTGTVGALTSVGAGVFAATVTITDPTTELAAITAGRAPAASSCELRIPPEAPIGVDVTTDRGSFVAGTGPLTVRVAARYPGAHHPAPIEVSIDADFGVPARATRAPDGTWVAAWTLPDRFDARTQARARIRVAIQGGESITSELVIALIAGEPASIETTLPGPLRADGESSATVAVRVLDRWGNSVGARTLTARGRGELTPFVASERGAAHARYTTPHSRIAGDDVIEIRDAVTGISARATLHLIPLPRRVQLSARAGYVSNLARVAAPMVTVSAGARLPVLGEALVADLFAGGYTTAVTSTAMTESVSGRLTAIPVLARVAFHGSRGSFDLWGGAGGGIAIARTHVTSVSTGTATSTVIAPAATVFAGVARKTGPGWILVEGAYVHATIDGALSGRIGGVVATAGFAVDL